MSRYLRILLVVVSVVQLVIGAAYFLRLPFAVRLWPLPYTTDISFIFIASIFAAAAASTLCCIVIREDGALAGVALDYLTILAPVAILMAQLGRGSLNSPPGRFGIACAAGAVFGLGLFTWSVRIPFQDSRPTPRLVRGSFAVFVIALLIAGGLMIFKVPNVLPWRLSSEAGVIYGWMFIGAAAYFIYGLLRPGWANAAGQLAGFLAYDLVLIVPFLMRLPTIEAHLRPNLIIYLLVIGTSGLLAIYYLFIHPGTRLWRPVQPALAA